MSDNMVFKAKGKVFQLYTTTIGHQLVFCSLKAHHAAAAVILVIATSLVSTVWA